METRVVRAASIVQPEGRTRGWAQADFEDIPVQQRLEFAPLRLFGHGTMHPGEGFDMHRHEGIENILLVRAGRMRHRGHDGSDWVLGPDDVFVMSAGAGAEHAEHVEGDASVDAVVIWLRTNAPTTKARFARRNFDVPAGHVRPVPIASGGRLECGGLPIRCDAAVLRLELYAGQAEHVMPRAGRASVAVLEGTMTVNGRALDAGDRMMVTGGGLLSLSSAARASAIIVQMLAPS